MKETIHVYPAESNTARADHILRLWGKEFSRLHYRMQIRTTQERKNSTCSDTSTS